MKISFSQFAATLALVRGPGDPGDGRSAAGEPAMAQWPPASTRCSSCSTCARRSTAAARRPTSTRTSPAHPQRLRQGRLARDAHNVPFMLPSIAGAREADRRSRHRRGEPCRRRAGGCALHRFRLRRARLLDAEGRRACAMSRSSTAASPPGRQPGCRHKAAPARRRRRKCLTPKPTEQPGGTRRRRKDRTIGRRHAGRRASGVLFRGQGEGAEGARPTATSPARSTSTATRSTTTRPTG